MGLLLGIIARAGGGGSSYTPPASLGQGLAFAPSGDWAIASTDMSGGDSYRLYQNTTNDFGTATLLYDGPLTTIEMVPMVAGTTNYIWWVEVNGGVEGTPVMGGLAVPNNAISERYAAIGDSNTFGVGGDSYAVQLDLENYGLSGWGIQRWMDGFWYYFFTNLSNTLANRFTVMLGTNNEGETDGAAQFDNLVALTNRIHEHGGQLLVMAPAKLNSPYDPVYFEDYAAAIEAGAEELKAYTTFNMLDLPHVGSNINSSTTDAAYWADAIHYSEAGQTIIADALAPILEQQRSLWLKKPYLGGTGANSGSGASNTFSKVLPTGYTYLDAQATIDGGLNWQDCTGSGTTASIVVGNRKREIGTVGIRLKAKYGGPLMQWNPPSDTVYNTVAFSSTFVETEIPYNDAAIVTTGSWSVGSGSEWYTNGTTEYVTITFTKGIRYIPNPILGSTATLFEFEVDGVVVAQEDIYGKTGKIMFEHFSGDNASHTLIIRKGANNWLGVGSSWFEINGFLLYS